MEKVGYPKHLGKNDRRETKRNTKKTKNGAQPPPYVQGMAFGNSFVTAIGRTSLINEGDTQQSRQTATKSYVPFVRGRGVDVAFLNNLQIHGFKHIFEFKVDSILVTVFSCNFIPEMTCYDN